MATCTGGGVTIGLIDSRVSFAHVDRLARSLGSGPALTEFAMVGATGGNDHRTQIASLIVGRGENSVGGVAAAPDALVIASILTANHPLDLDELAALLRGRAAFAVSHT